jgi:ABC-type antimicrobial peptide transport system permease subunit
VLLGIFAAASLLLSGMGIYGVTAYAVRERTREFTIRIALGAQRPLRFVLRHAVMAAALGIAAGVAASWVLARVMTALLFNVSATDWRTLTVSMLILAAITLLASYVPARRAAAVDPMKLLS